MFNSSDVGRCWERRNAGSLSHNAAATTPTINVQNPIAILIVCRFISLSLHEEPSNARHHPPAHISAEDESRRVAGRVHAVVRLRCRGNSPLLPELVSPAASQIPL